MGRKVRVDISHVQDCLKLDLVDIDDGEELNSDTRWGEMKTKDVGEGNYKNEVEVVSGLCGKKEGMLQNIDRVSNCDVKAEVDVALEKYEKKEQGERNKKRIVKKYLLI